MSQAKRILQHLLTGRTITPREAYERFGTLALHSRIAELRSQGVEIDMVMHQDGRIKWGEYSLREVARG